MAARRRGAGHHTRRGVILAAMALAVAVGVTFPAQHALHEPGLPLAMGVVATLIVIGALGDMLGIAAAAAAESALHSMAARRRPGARAALGLKRHADRVASISGDIVGDVAGTVSGAAATAWAVAAAGRHGWSVAVAVAGAVALVAALTVGAKGTLKGVAMDHANSILYAAGCVALVLRTPLGGWLARRPARTAGPGPERDGSR